MAKKALDKIVLTEDLIVVESSNNGGRIHRLGYLEIIGDDTEKVETEGMPPRNWMISVSGKSRRLPMRAVFVSTRLSSLRKMQRDWVFRSVIPAKELLSVMGFRFPAITGSDPSPLTRA